MLGKLLRHEWRAVWKVPVLLISILFVTATVAGLTFALPIWNSEWVGLPLSGVMLIMVFYVAMLACALGIAIYFAVRYYKNMFTDEGYLTNTLPVSARQLLLNKVITMSAWNLIGGVAIVLSLVIFGGITILSLMPRSSTFARDAMEGIRQLFLVWPELLKEPEMEGFGGFCISILCMVLVGTVSNTMMLIGAITLGQMVRKHRILGAVGAYFGINMAVQFIIMAIIFPYMTVTAFGQNRWDLDVSPFPVMTSFYVIMTVVSLAVAVGLYFLSEYLIRRQLELE